MRPIASTMEESLILSRFDNLVQSGLVLYDDKQHIIEHIEGELKVRLHRPQTLTSSSPTSALLTDSY